MHHRHLIAFLAAALAAVPLVLAQPGGAPVGDMDRVDLMADVPFAVVDGRELLLDLYLPQGVESPPLLVWVHGGGWARGTRAPVSTVALVNAGYAMASVDYRLSGEAPFPAQIHDVKAAIRFLRANAQRYGFDGRRIGIVGVSAGAHLAALAGVTNGDAYHEGSVGTHLDQSSDVTAIVSYFGASNLTSILDQSTPFGLNIRVPGLTALFGGTVEEKPELARAASPLFQVDAQDPPLLLLHGDQDPQMPINQSHELHGAYKAQGLDVHFEVVHGARHGGPQFFDAERTALVVEFLDRTLGKAH
jgi:acetyl esterase/lipase